jgi:hypothetical protein
MFKNAIMLLVWELGFGSHRSKDDFFRHLVFYSVEYPMEKVGPSLKLVNSSPSSSRSEFKDATVCLRLFLVELWGTLLLAHLVEALRYKPEGRGFDFQWCHNPSVRIMAMGLTQPLTE